MPLGSEAFMRAGPEEIWTPGCVVGHNHKSKKNCDPLTISKIPYNYHKSKSS